MTLQFFVKNQRLYLNAAQRRLPVASDSKNYLKARFIFQSLDWLHSEGHYALFTYKGKTYKRFLGQGNGLEQNECYIPEEVLKEGTFTVSLFAGDLITTITDSITVESSGYTEDIELEDLPPDQDWLGEKITIQIEKYLLENDFVIDAN